MLEERKAAVMSSEENDFRRKFRETLEILNQSLTLNRDRGFEPPAWCGDVARDYVHRSSHDKQIPAIFTRERRCDSVESLNR